MIKQPLKRATRWKRTFMDQVSWCVSAASLAPAIVSSSGAIHSHAQLSRCLQRLGDQLRQADVRERSPIVLLLPEGPVFVTSLLAVTTAWSCAPLNPALTWLELEALIHDIGPAAVIVSCGLPALLQPVLSLGYTVFLAGDSDKATASDEVTWTLLAAGDRLPPVQTDAAILLHTSATTGRSKLVGLTRANLTASMQSTCAGLQLTPADRVLLLSPLFHLQGILSAMTQLHAGGSVIAAGSFQRGDFSRWLQQLKPTWYTCGPSLHRTICARLRTHGDRDSTLSSSLRFVRSIGAPLAPTLARDIKETLGVPVLNGYGLTETGVLTSMPPEFASTHAGSVGKSMGAQVRVVDGNDHTLPPGEEGEIVARGANVTDGYVGDPEANRVAFRNGWFHTGDLGTVDSDGFVYLTGRLKEQINHAGEKIHPGEIDEVLLTHPDVLEAAAFGLPHASVGENIFCAAVLSATASVTSAELRRFVAKELAAFKVPRQIFMVDHIPRGATGKPKRYLLSAQFATATALQVAEV